MNLRKEIRENREQESLVVAKLAVAYSLLEMAPFDSWGHEGDAAEMAVWIVMDAKKQGRLGMLERMILGNNWYRDSQ